mmetsp:Transcript_12733/g.27498  ORF Transcript_12733/g.27498 Transcript_12733/m.27498 type:complete len:269 (+) Transcript_12733:153-959(+)
MSRAFAPPDTLSEDDVRTVADVRRALWINGLCGLGAGSVIGATGHVALRTLQRRYVSEEAASSTITSQTARAAAGKASDAGLVYRILRQLPPLGKNTFMFSLLGGGALGSFVMSTTAGKNTVHLLHPIFDVGRDEHAGKSPYQIAMTKGHNQRHGGNDATTNTVNTVEDELDAAHHRARSLCRKASMKHRLENGQSLSDTHGNTWPHSGVEVSEELQRNKAAHRAEACKRRQTKRREAIRDRIERGNALSDSTGGHWSGPNGGEQQRT